MILDGKLVSQKIKDEVKEEISKLNKNGETVCLAVVLVGNNKASEIYVRNKINCCDYVGMQSKLIRLDETANQNEIIDVVNQLNKDKSVNGIIVQLPLPKGIDEDAVLNSIDFHKDVDGCHYIQKGKLFTQKNQLVPCTPLGVMELLKEYKISVDGKNVLIIGRSNLVGRPLAELMLQSNGTVTIAHSHTKNIPAIIKNADIVCLAIGKANFVKADILKKDSVVIDVGINRDGDGKLCGDVEKAAIDKVKYITPVPGGVGPMTVTMLIKNTLTAYKFQKGAENEKQ